MFSKGQIIFGIIFALVFLIVIIRSYKKDASLHKKYYNGTFWVLMAFIAFIASIAGIKFILGY
tara:strand:+ start:2730 stop:2918 length:189 start_codon:yes stop_codon:yes gene_type:complete